jgi:hypothetical protein
MDQESYCTRYSKLEIIKDILFYILCLVLPIAIGFLHGLLSGIIGCTLYKIEYSAVVLNYCLKMGVCNILFSHIYAMFIVVIVGLGIDDEVGGLLLITLIIVLIIFSVPQPILGGAMLGDMNYPPVDSIISLSIVGNIFAFFALIILTLAGLLIMRIPVGIFNFSMFIFDFLKKKCSKIVEVVEAVEVVELDIV